MTDSPLLRGEVSCGDDYRVLLAMALEATSGAVLEMGVHPAQRLVHEACEVAQRPLVSLVESFDDYLDLVEFKSPRHEVSCCAYDLAPLCERPWSVALLKHAPGERRWVDAVRLADSCEIIVLHDTEPAADHGYQYSRLWPEFRHRVDVKTEGAWATAVSRTRDLSAWRGRRVGRYVVSLGEEDVRADPTHEAIRRVVEGDVDFEGRE